jgi:catechol 2,3-dioxygenase-like lactoylglutathione lyase family enzyme
MLDHVTLAVADYAKSKAFYLAALAPLDCRLLFEAPAAISGSNAYGGFGATRPQFWIGERGMAGGPVHVAFAAKNEDAVRAFYAAAMAAGGRDNGAPGLRPHYHPNYYGAFVLDPDGNNVEAVFHG